MIKFELTEQEVQVVGSALGKMPFDTVAALIQKLNQQLVSQQTPAPVTTEEPASA